MTASKQMLSGEDGEDDELGGVADAETIPRVVVGRARSGANRDRTDEALKDTLPAPDANSAAEYDSQQIVDGRLRLIRRLGAGGMGEVWEAEQFRPKRAVAVKLLAEKYSGDEAMKRRFLREARICARIHHKNIVRVYDVGTTEAGIPYYVMELLDGLPLTDLIADAKQLDVDRTLSILFQIACALEEAHGSKIIHRDLKPENVIAIVGPDEGNGPSILCKLIDFGLAKRVDLDPSASKLTQTGAVFGTPAYMSPEQIEGHATDERADVYSFGCLAYEVVLGTPPFKGDNLANLFFQHLFTPCPSVLDGVEARHHGDSRLVALDGLIRWTLQKDPAQRPSTMAEVADAINSISLGLDVEPLGPRRDGGAKPRHRERRRFARGAVVATAVTGAFVIGSALAYWATLPSDADHTASAATPTAPPREPPTQGPSAVAASDTTPPVTIALGNEALPCTPQALANGRIVGHFDGRQLVLPGVELPSDVVIRCAGFMDYLVHVDATGVQAPVVLVAEAEATEVEEPSPSSDEEAAPTDPLPTEQSPALVRNGERASKGRKPSKSAASTEKRPRDDEEPPPSEPAAAAPPKPAKKQSPPPLLAPDAPPKVPTQVDESKSKRAPFRTE